MIDNAPELTPSLQYDYPKRLARTAVKARRDLRVGSRTDTTAGIVECWVTLRYCKRNPEQFRLYAAQIAITNEQLLRTFFLYEALSLYL